VTLGQRLVTIFDNPLIIKDGVSRMRTWRAPALMTVYLGVLGVFGYSVFVVEVQTGQSSGAAQMGATVFGYLAFIQISLISLFAPALAAGAISGERERQTLDVLLVSRVTALGIVWGKLVASVAFMLLLILAALPLFAAVFLFGGIDFQQFLVTQLLTVTTAVSLGAASIFLSALFKRPLTSTVAAYGLAVGALLGTLAAGALLTVIIDQRQGSAGVGAGALHPFLFFNPIWALVTALQASGNPMTLGQLISNFFLLPAGSPGVGPSLEPWQGTVLLQLAVIAASVFGAVHLLRGRRAPQPRPLQEPEDADEVPPTEQELAEL
jgi:ABC-2 type transport system permease protein